jgi:UDP-N-acetylmuramate--alanine ligase
MKESFVKYASGSKKVIVNMDCSNALECAKNSTAEVVTYSISNKNSKYYADNIIVSKGKTFFDLYINGTKVKKFELGVPGMHNLSNSLAAISASIKSKISLDAIERGFKNFKGIKRRLEFLGKINGAYIYDDYAHHPDEIIATLDAAETMGMKKIYCLFQPHTYTRLKDFFQSFADIFNQRASDKNIEVIFLPTYAAREKNILGYDTEKLSHAVNNSIFLDSLYSAAEFIKTKASKDEMYILMGAGDITNVSKLLEFDK